MFTSFFVSLFRKLGKLGLSSQVVSAKFNDSVIESLRSLMIEDLQLEIKRAKHHKETTYRPTQEFLDNWKLTGDITTLYTSLEANNIKIVEKYPLGIAI